MVDFEGKYNTPSMKFGQIFKDTVDILKVETGKRVIKYSNAYFIQAWLLQ